MSKSTINFLIDSVALAAIVLLASTGVLMRYVLPPGSGHFLKLWEMDRHEWGQIHFWIAVALLVALVLHLFMHWRWIVGIIQGRPGKGAVVRISLSIIILLALAALAAAPLVSPVAEVQNGEPPRKMQAQEERHSPLVNGSMTLQEVEAKTGVPVEVILQELKLPADVPTDERLGRLRRQYGFEMHEVQEIVRKHGNEH